VWDCISVPVLPVSPVPAVTFSAIWEGFSVAIYTVHLLNVSVLIIMRVKEAYMKFFYLVVKQKISLIR